MTLRSFNDLFGVQAVVICDTPAEAVAEALRRAQEERNRAGGTITPSKPVAASGPPRKVLKKR